MEGRQQAQIWMLKYILQNQTQTTSRNIIYLYVWKCFIFIVYYYFSVYLMDDWLIENYHIFFSNCELGFFLFKDYINRRHCCLNLEFILDYNVWNMTRAMCWIFSLVAALLQCLSELFGLWLFKTKQQGPLITDESVIMSCV